MAREDTAALYDRDFFEWTVRNAELLRRGCLEEADLDHLAEEIEDLGRRDKREVSSRLIVLIAHLLKWQYQPGLRYSPSGTSSWLNTIREQRRELDLIFDQSGSLQRLARESLEWIYAKSVELAAEETNIPVGDFPSGCPFRLDQILENKFLPE
jgi:hypothetical protein